MLSEYGPLPPAVMPATFTTLYTSLFAVHEKKYTYRVIFSHSQDKLYLKGKHLLTLGIQYELNLVQA